MINNGKVKSPFLIDINIYKIDSNTRCSLAKYTVCKLISGVISLLSMSIPNVFLKNAILCPIGANIYYTYSDGMIKSVKDT